MFSRGRRDSDVRQTLYAARMASSIAPEIRPATPLLICEDSFLPKNPKTMVSHSQKVPLFTADGLASRLIPRPSDRHASLAGPKVSAFAPKRSFFTLKSSVFGQNGPLFASNGKAFRPNGRAFTSNGRALAADPLSFLPVGKGFRSDESAFCRPGRPARSPSASKVYQPCRHMAPILPLFLLSRQQQQTKHTHYV